MWKWIGIAILTVIVVFVGAAWWGYQKLTAGGDTVAVTIAAPHDRVFSSLSNHDSLSTWWYGRESTPSSHHGPIAVGDTLPMEGSKSGRRNARISWTATEVIPGRLLAVAISNDSTGQIFAVRRDSLVDLGDSTMVVSSIGSPMMDSLRAPQGPDAPSHNPTLMDMTSKMLVSGFRLASKAQLTRLKNHIEGRPDTPLRP
jgi:uncharacterized protein YndB with AHSA1/START domain